MDEKKIERKVANEKTELPSESEFPKKCIQSENDHALPSNSPPFNNQATTEPKTFTRGLKLMQSFRKATLTSVKEKSTEAEVDEKKKEIKKSEGKTELQLEPASPAKGIGSEDGHGHPPNSLPFNNQGTTEPKTFTRGLKLMQSFRKATLISVKEKSTEAEVDEKKKEIKKAEGKTELQLEPASPAKGIESEDGHGHPPNSPPFNNQATTEPKTFTRGLKLMQSFRKATLTSVKEKSTEAEVDEKKKEIKKAEGKTELQLEPASPAKGIGSEDGHGHPPNSLPFNNQGTTEPKTFTRGLKLMQSFRKATLISVKEKSTEAEVDEKKKEIKKAEGKTELQLEPAFPVKGVESEDGHDLPPNSPSFNNQGTTEPKILTRDLKLMQSFTKDTLTSVEEKSTEAKMDEKKKGIKEIEGKTEFWLEPASPAKEEEDADISRRSSKRFSIRGLKLMNDGDQANKGSSNILRKKKELEGEESVLKEPLSVMQIYELIQKRQLLEAFRNIKGLETELLAEGEAKKYEDNSKEYTMRAKDITLLYNSVSREIEQIVEITLDIPILELEGLITEMVAVIKEEEKIHAGAINIPEPSDSVKQLGLARNWRKLWERAIRESVKRRIHKVQIPQREDSPNWLSVHLGFLKTVIRKDLLTIKHGVQNFYPQDFNVCDTYLKVFHEALSLHLQNILEDKESCLEFRQFHALLNWVTNICYSEDLLGHPDLKPEMKTEDLPSLLTPDILDKLKRDYVNSLKGKTKKCLENILCLETEKWDSEEQPEALQCQYSSFLSFDIQTFIAEHLKAAGSICKNLERTVLEMTVKEAIDFIPCFGEAFLEWDNAKDCPWFASLMVAYINDFHDLRTGLQTKFNVSCEDMEKTLSDLTLKYKKHFFKKLRLKTQPMFKKILSQVWISQGKTLDSFIMKILGVVEDLSKDLKNLKDPMRKDFLNEVHKYVVKEYIMQILKPRGRMNRIKREEVSNIMHCEATIINNTMQDLGSSADWLFDAIPYIASIIAEKKKQKIEDYIKDFSRDYPDISSKKMIEEQCSFLAHDNLQWMFAKKHWKKEHISAILALRGLGRKKKKSIVDQMDDSSEKLESGSDKTLFAEIELQNTIMCF